jgi:dihydrofolate reductase
MIKLIVAISTNRCIGKDNTLIWKLPSDLKRFKQITSGQTVVMGRKTFQSIGKPLPKRRNIIITRDEGFLAEGCEVVNSIEEALLLSAEDCFIIGGSEIYKQTIGIADKIYLTVVHQEFDGDSFFPEIGFEWKETKREDFQKCEKNNFDYSFIDYERYQF